jgi:hypothetical protein
MEVLCVVCGVKKDLRTFIAVEKGIVWRKNNLRKDFHNVLISAQCLISAHSQGIYK